MPEPAGVPDPEDGTSLLAWHARELYNDLRLVPMLRQLMMTSCRLTGSAGGSISIVDAAAGRYMKVAERGTACRLGESFPLDQGVTGQVVSRRRPVVLASYREVATGHLRAGHPASEGAVAAIPIWWRGDVIGANVVFAGVTRPFAPDEVDHLELLTQVIAPGVATAVERELPTTQIRRPPLLAGEDQDAEARTSGTRAGDGSVAAVALDLLELAQRAAADAGWSPPSCLDVTVLSSDESPRLLIRGGGEGRSGPDSGGDPDDWHELVDAPGGGIAAQLSGGRPGVALWGTPVPSPSPFSSRERQVAILLARGSSDRAIASELCISPKTVEKHVSAVLRKTGTTSRTSAAVHCVQRGWAEAAVDVR